MGMIMQYIRIRDDELATLRSLLTDDPNGAFDFADALADGAGDDVPVEHSRGMDLDKSWDALAFLLDRAGPLTTCVVHDGVELTRDDWGIEPPRYLTPDQVSRGATELESLPFERLAAQFDPPRMAEVYPGNWGDREADQLAYLRTWYGLLRRFLRHAADQRDGMLVFLS